MRVDTDDGMMKVCRDDKMCVIGSERGYWGKVDQNRTCYSIMSRIFLLMIESSTAAITTRNNAVSVAVVMWM